MTQPREINIKIRSMNGHYATMGLFLEGSDRPDVAKLMPLDVVTVTEDHPIWNSDACALIEPTFEEANRPYAFESVQEARAHGIIDDTKRAAMYAASAQIQSSLDKNKAIRAENQRRMRQMIDAGEISETAAQGVVPPPAPDGLAPARADNAVTRGGQQETVVAPEPPPKRRRGRPRKNPQ